MFRLLSMVFATFALLGSGCARSGRPAPDFTLTDQQGAPWSLAGQQGKVVALFFGYTHCLDTCPATLAKLAKAIASQPDGSDAEIAFVTVDPQRDTPPVLAQYITRFSGATIVGLTGTPQQVIDVEHRFHVWAQKIPGRRGNDNYEDDHTAIVFVIDRHGRITSMPDDADSVATVAADLHAALQ